MISIVIPVYNVKEYLPKCIESVLAQSYRSFELILVDDGSTDGSGEICDNFALKDSRIRVIHKTNGGVSSARNIGMRLANGEYISFIDSDDYIGKEYLQNLLTVMTQSNADMVVGGELSVTARNILPFRFQNTMFLKNDFSKLFSEYDLQKRCSPWGKLLKSQIIKKADLEFDEHIHLGEDIIFMFRYISLCNSVYLSESTEYYYVQRGGSLTKRLNCFDSEARGYVEYTRAKGQLIEQFDLDKTSCLKLNQWSIIFLDRVKNSILNLSSKSQKLNAFSRFEWSLFRRYKTYGSIKEYLWDSLLWLKCYNIFLLIHKFHKI